MYQEVTVKPDLEAANERLEEVSRADIFSFDELRTLSEQQTQFEYMAANVEQSLEYFEEYIVWHKSLLSEIRSRTINDPPATLESTILNKIKELYETGYQKYSNHFPFCMDYYKFCNDLYLNQDAYRLIQHLITNFPDDSDGWKVAASWYATNNKPSTLSIVFRGLALHPDCEGLYWEGIHFLLVNTIPDQPTPSGFDTSVEACCRINMFIQGMCKHVPNVHFFCDVLKMFLPYTFTLGVQHIVMKWITTKYSNEEMVWHTLAQRERGGIHYELNPAREPENTKYFVNKCIGKYLEGLQVIGAANRPALWLLYMEFLFELRATAGFKTLAVEKLLAAFERANQDCRLPENYFMEWANLTEDGGENPIAILVMEKAVAEHPYSVELWQRRLGYAMQVNNGEQFDEVFQRSITNLQQLALPCWEQALRYYDASGNINAIESIYKEAIKQAEEISSVMKLQYVQWLFGNKGLIEARRVYRIIARWKPYCQKLHEVMLNLESTDPNGNFRRKEIVLKLARRQFGKEDPNVYMDLLNFYRQHRHDYMRRDRLFNLPKLAVETIKEGHRYFNDPYVLQIFQRTCIEIIEEVEIELGIVYSDTDTDSETTDNETSDDEPGNMNF